MKLPVKIQPLEFEKPIVELEEKLADLRKHSKANDLNFEAEMRRMEEKLMALRREIYSNLTPWERVQISRHPARPFALDYFQLSFQGFVELHGDRLFGDDAAMPGGFARMGEHRCAVVGQQKGRDTKENLKRNFGTAHPEGYRKALRLMRLAQKFGLAFVSLIDTPGAYPGVGAEERHISEAIAVNLREMMTLRAPIVAVVIGEGGSGGALGIGVADRVLMLENSYYSVISPEGCAAILWKHRKHAPEAAAALRLNARDLLEMHLIDDVVAEPLGGAHQDQGAAISAVQAAIQRHLDELTVIPLEELLRQRYQKFRRIGEFEES
ncbi:MAG TPA: acetyl-CoA carboxylase carboxyltransferase subunit alpha [Chthoniobacteraceae bacterium]